MTKRKICGALALSLAMAAACGPKAPPKPEPTSADQEPVEPPPPPVADASPAAEAAPQPAPPPAKTFALCSVPKDPTKTQCLTWTGCAGGIVQTYAGNPVRKCAATADACAEAEKKLGDEAQKLKAASSGAPRVCKMRNYLKKEIRIDDTTVFVCPEDEDDRPLTELWRQLAGTCKEPISP